MKALGTVAQIIETANQYIGKTISWLTLGMVLMQFVVVMMRYVFGIGSVIMQESIVYMHAVVFLVAAGYTLVHNGHVRCDIFYGDASIRIKALIDLFGILVFLLPMCVLIFWLSWPYVGAAWAVREGSPEGSMGIPGVYLLKTTILIFAALLILQGISLALRSLLVLTGVAGHRGLVDGSGGPAA